MGRLRKPIRNANVTLCECYAIEPVTPVPPTNPYPGGYGGGFNSGGNSGGSNGNSNGNSNGGKKGGGIGPLCGLTRGHFDGNVGMLSTRISV